MRILGKIILHFIRTISALNTLPTINNQLSAIDKSPLVTRKIQTHIGHIIRLRQSSQWHIPEEFLPVLRGVLETSEHGEKTRSAEQRSYGVDANVMWAVFSCETFGSL